MISSDVAHTLQMLIHGFRISDFVLFPLIASDFYVENSADGLPGYHSGCRGNPALGCVSPEAGD